jgi:hypothetical protein
MVSDGARDGVRPMLQRFCRFALIVFNIFIITRTRGNPRHKRRVSRRARGTGDCGEAGERRVGKPDPDPVSKE